MDRKTKNIRSKKPDKLKLYMHNVSDILNQNKFLLNEETKF